MPVRDRGVVAAETSTSPRRVTFATRDQDEARDFMDRTYGACRLQVAGGLDTDWRLAVDQVTVPQVAAAALRLPAELSFDIEGQDDFVINTLLSGEVEYDRDRVHRFQAGEVYVGNHPRLHCACRTYEVHVHTLTLPRSLLSEVAGFTAEDPPVGWELSSLLAGKTGAGHWRKAVRFFDGLLADPAAAHPLVIGAAARLLAATALAAFPGMAAREETATDRRGGNPGPLKRAIAFIEANPGVDLCVTDIAHAASVTPRGLQLAFRRGLDTTPMRYLRQVRLAHAHDELAAATPEEELTVTTVAYRWGFSSASRFAQHYRAAYGVTPSATLHS